MDEAKLELGFIEYDFLKELGNVGAGNATTSLSILLDSKLSIGLPIVSIFEFEELANMLGGLENVVVAVISEVQGDLNGMMLFALEADKARNLVNILVDKDQQGCDGCFSDMELSAMREIGNILNGTYLTALESLTNLKIKANPPETCVDMAGAILNVPAIEFGISGDKALVIQAMFKDNDSSISGYIMLISEAHSYDKLYESMKIGG